MAMTVDEAHAQMVDLFPGCSVSVQVHKWLFSTGNRDESFIVAAVEPCASKSWTKTGYNIDSLMSLARIEAERRAMEVVAKTAEPQSVSAAAECVTSRPCVAAGGAERGAQS